MSREKITTEHTAASWESEIGKHFKGETTDIYARGGYPELRQREKKFAEITGTLDTALFNSGMAAIHTAVEAEELKPGDVVLCGRDVYSQTKKMWESFGKKGLIIELCDSGDMAEIERVVKEKRPRLIILEDVANSSKMQVCDLKKLSEIAARANNQYKEELTFEKLLDNYLAKRGKSLGSGTREEILKIVSQPQSGGSLKVVARNIAKEFGLNNREAVREAARMIKYLAANSRDKLSLIIDNTLASPVLYNPAKDLEGSKVEMVVVESGTKHYQAGQDEITLGLAYSNQAEKIEKIKRKRAELGTYLQPNDEKEIPADIVETMPEIVGRHADNALKLAKLIEDSAKAIEVSHPNLESHQDHELAQRIAPQGLVTLFYIRIKEAPKFVKKLEQVAGHKIGIGASFGHKKTWVLNLGEETVRIAVGSESEEEFDEVLDSFKKALNS